ncbi:hypothetical protein BGX33_012009, partial [Mortierella sp. NVP41]
MIQGDLPPVIQGVRPLSINNLDSPTPSAPAAITYIDCHLDPVTKKQVVLWHHIEQAFGDALFVRYQSKLVPFVIGEDLSLLKPYRLAANPDIVWDVVVSGQLTQAEAARPSPSRLEQIEQQASRFPIYNPLERLRSRPPTLTNPLVPQYNTAQMRHNHQQTVKGIMKKIASHVDLEALYEKGDGSPKDFPKALECYLKTFHQGHALALISVGDLFVNGQGVTRDPSLAMAWYFKAACQGDNNAQRKFEALRLAESRRATMPRNADLQAVEDEQLFRTNSDTTEETSQEYQLKSGQEDLKTEKGKGVTHIASIASAASTTGETIHVCEEPVIDNIDNPATIPPSSVSLTLLDDQKQHKGDSSELQRSSNKSQPQAPQEYPVPVTKDFTKAMISATSGNKDAQFDLGNMYRNGHGVQLNYLAAMEWYLKAADQGHAIAQCNLGLMYSRGDGISPDYSLAMVWYRKAADQGNADAQFGIGFMFANGQGVTQDYSRAMDWYRTAADQGHLSAQFYIGVLHSSGL